MPNPGFSGATQAAVLLSSLLLAGVPVCAHDLVGIIKEKKNLTPESRGKIETREALRDPDVVAGITRMTAAVSRNHPGAAAALASPTTALGGPAFQVAQAKALWPREHTIRICFLDGSQESRLRFMQVYKDVLRHTDLHVDESTNNCPSPGAEIRVSFNDKGSYSYIGTDALLIEPKTAPTLNLEGMGENDNWSEEDLGRARHEIMHSIAMEHEHQHPDVKCNFDFNKILQLLAPFGWSAEDVQTNFAKITRTPDIITTPINKTSIMHYQLPAVYFKDGAQDPCFLLKENTKLSPEDISFIRALYP